MPGSRGRLYASQRPRKAYVQPLLCISYQPHCVSAPTSSTIAKVLHHIVNAQDKLEAIATLQPLKSIPARVAPQTTAAIAQFWTEMNCLRDAADMLTPKNECDHIVASVVEAASLACHDAKRWLKAYSEVRLYKLLE